MKEKFKSQKLSNLLKDKEREIFLVILLSGGMLVILGLMILGLSGLFNKYGDYGVVATRGISIIISFIILPYYILKKYEDIKLEHLGLYKIRKLEILIIIILLLVGLCFLKNKYNDQHLFKIVISLNIFVAIGEEFIMRGSITYLLKKIFSNIYIAYIISILIFVFHSGSNFIENCNYRLPITIVLTYLYHKTDGIYFSTVIHLLYNIWASSLICI